LEIFFKKAFFKIFTIFKFHLKLHFQKLKIGPKEHKTEHKSPGKIKKIKKVD
jgi:hypothetical protein